MSQRVIIIIPAYNEERTIAGVLNGLRQAAPEYERIVINDGSKDATAEIVDALGETQLKLPCNLGYGRALQTGLKYALAGGYDAIVTFDADGQHQPEDVPRIISTLIKKEADLVIGSRYCDGSSYSGPFGRRMGQRVFSKLTRLLIGKRIYDTSSGFKALTASAAQIVIDGTFLDFHIETLVRLRMFGYKIEELPIKMRERNFGQSMHSITSFLDYPIKTLLLTIVAAVDAIIARRKK
jgi:glycosyltransferase involved in cell wall biosynthesis